MSVAEVEVEVDVVRPVRVILREFVKNVVDGEDEIDNQEIVQYALSRFAHDAEFTTAAARDCISVMVPDVLGEVIRSMRAEFVSTPSGAKRRSAIDETARERFAKVFEGTGAGYKTFLALKKSHLIALNERDSKENQRREQWIALRAGFAKQMNATETVGERFSGPELDAAWKKHFQTETPA